MSVRILYSIDEGAIDTLFDSFNSLVSQSKFGMRRGAKDIPSSRSLIGPK